MSSSNSYASPPSLADLSGAALFLPWFFGLPALNSEPREVAILVHHPSHSITLVEGALDDESLIREIPPTDDGSFPATKASIESLPRVHVTEPGVECAICLAEVNGAVKEMPCGHRFHSGCIDRWLGIRGSCPVCRFCLPCTPVRLRKESVEDGGWRIHTFYVPEPETGRVEGVNLVLESNSEGDENSGFSNQGMDIE